MNKENKMVLDFTEINKLDQFEQADVLWGIIERMSFKNATMERVDGLCGGYTIELECEENDEE